MKLAISMIAIAAFGSATWAQQDAPPPPMTPAEVQKKAVSTEQAGKVTDGSLIGSLDLATPENPAFFALGLSPENIDRPSSWRSLVTSFRNGLDSKGRPKQGIAIEFSPFRLNAQTVKNLETYKNDNGTRIRQNITISIGSSEGASENDLSQRIAVGFRTLLIDEGDPVRNANQDLLIRTLQKQKFPVPDMNAPAEDYDKLIKPILESVAKGIRPMLEDKPKWSIAFAPVFMTPDRTKSSLKSDGFGAWTSFSKGVGASKKETELGEGKFSTGWNQQMILHARVRTDERVANPDGGTGTVKQNTSLVGLRYRAGDNKLKVSLEGCLCNTKLAGKKADNGSLLAVVVEPHLGPDLWATLSVTRDTRAASKTPGLKFSVRHSFNGF